MAALPAGIVLTDEDLDEIFPHKGIPAAFLEDDGQKPGPGEVLAKRPEIPERLFSLPGFVGDVMDITMSTAKFPNRQLAFAGALGLMSHLTGRVVRTESDLRSNLYVLALGNPSIGKDQARRVNRAILEEVDLGNTVINRFGSGEGLQDALQACPCLLAQADEISHLLESVKRDTSGNRLSVTSELLEIYTSANQPYRTRVLSSRPSEVIQQPHLTLLGTATPGGLYGSLSKAMVRSGLLARMFVIEAGPRGARQRPKIITISDEVANQARYWANLSGQQRGEPRTVSRSPKAHEVFEGAENDFDVYWRDSDKRGDIVGTSVWGRAGALAEKLALIHVLSRDPMAEYIDEEAAVYGHEMAWYHADTLLDRAENHIHENQFEENCQKLLQMIRETSAREMDRSSALRSMHMKASDFAEVVNVLTETGRLGSEKRGRTQWYLAL